MQKELLVKMVLDAWHSYIKRTDDLLNELSQEQLMKQVSPGRNRGIYLLGHLAAVHDRVLSLLNLGDPIRPELYEIFVVQADNHNSIALEISDLLLYWKNVNSTLAERFSKMHVEEWFQKHTSVSEEDFAKEPHRNKLNIIINRTNHLAAHFGQLIFLKTKNCC